MAAKTDKPAPERPRREPVRPGSTSRKAKVLLVDDHPIIRKGLADLINQEQDLVVAGEAEDAGEALLSIAGLNPDVALVDLSLRGRSGLDLIKDIRARFPDVAVLVLSMHDESLYAERALLAGARGYVMKDQATEFVMVAIRKVLSGQIYVSESMASRMLSNLAAGRNAVVSVEQTLSDRELQVLELIGSGLSTSQIARRMQLSVKTVETYRANIKRKLRIEGAAELVRHAVQWVQSR